MPTDRQPPDPPDEFARQRAAEAAAEAAAEFIHDVVRGVSVAEAIELLREILDHL